MVEFLAHFRRNPLETVEVIHGEPLKKKTQETLGDILWEFPEEFARKLLEELLENFWNNSRGLLMEFSGIKKVHWVNRKRNPIMISKGIPGQNLDFSG